LLSFIESTVKQVNKGKFNNQKLLEEICGIFDITLSADPCRTRIGSYYKGTQILERYWDEIIELAKTRISETEDGVKWKKVHTNMQKISFRFYVSFVLDLYENAFLPFLSYFENAKTLEKKIIVREKLDEFLKKTNQMLEEITNFGTMENIAEYQPQYFTHVHDLRLKHMGFQSFKTICEKMKDSLENFKTNYFGQMHFWNEYPFKCIDLLSVNPTTVISCARELLQMLQNPNDDFVKFNEFFLFYEDTLVEMARGDLSNYFDSNFLSNLKKIYDAMTFTDCYSERIFSVQNQLQRTKRNVTIEFLRQYLFLVLNDTYIPEEEQYKTKYVEEMRRIREEEKDETKSSSYFSAGQIYEETFFQDYLTETAEFTDTIRLLTENYLPDDAQTFTSP